MKKILRIFTLPLFFLFFTTQNLPAQGNWEFGFHYSQWSIDIFRGLIEEGISEAMEENLRDMFLEDIQEDYPFLEETSYHQEVGFDSGGQNYGFEVRWYPAGKEGSYSMGFSIEKTFMRVSLTELSASMSLEDQITHQTASFQGSIDEARFEIRPLSFHLSFRWDIKPSWRWRPYITFGFGMAGAGAIENGEFNVSWSGRLNIAGDEEVYEGSESKTLEELREEMEEDEDEFFLPGFMPFVQLNLGLKGEVVDNLYLLIDVGIWDGLLFRVGIAYRL